jgi:hypothetical protein
MLMDDRHMEEFCGAMEKERLIMSGYVVNWS